MDSEQAAHHTLSVPLARHLLDRDGTERTRDGLIAQLRASEKTAVLLLRSSRALLAQRVDGSPAALEFVAPSVIPPSVEPIYLGRATAGMGLAPGTPILAALVADADGQAVCAEEARWQGLRTIAPELGDAEAGLLAQAIAIEAWHDSHRHCPRCGAATQVRAAGWVRHCPVDNIEIFPRPDPAVIVLITDADDRVLLGSNASWAPGRYSLLAGFVEPGESLEHAVAREMKEESGLDVVDPRYRASQPWPFPASIMLGFTATLAADQSPEDLKPDGVEILDLRWFTRAQLAEAIGDVVLPGASSIARALLEEWYGGALIEMPRP
jgi:NAD+ diphosphatase